MSRWAQTSFAGWGRVHKASSPAARPERQSELRQALAGQTNLLAHGAGRSYGDVALNSAGRAIVTTRLDRLLSFDPATGLLVAEPGVTFADLFRTFVPLGFVPPVAPGTGSATLGGGVANDVHGKNHHVAGSLGRHLEWLDLRLASGAGVRVQRSDDTALWRATVGGMGLSGVIERVALRMRPVPSNALTVRKRRIADLDAFLSAFADESQTEYVVGWIDALARGASLGRGILETASPADGNIVEDAPRSRRMPFDLPSMALNSLTVGAFNALYRRHVPVGGSTSRMSYERFLFPLDAIHQWNRIYGRRGFHQFQCVLPFADGAPALRRLLESIARSGRGSFLAVLKRMGDQGRGYMSFPAPGLTLALDFPNAPGAVALIGELERITADSGGRVYLAKDATLTPELLPLMYPDLASFRAVLEEVDPARVFGSDMSRRLVIRPAAP
jgi:decaprenylphospho-beta-D-ribofuranose 2-oxidase